MASNLAVPSQVTAALIPVQGRLFIAQRPPNKKFGLLWEFPGGKVESGESLQDSLIREIGEELCWEIQVGSLFQHLQCRLLDLNIDLYAFWCTIIRGELCLREHVAFHWAKASELRQFRFTDVDRQLVLMIAELSELPQGSRSTHPPGEPYRPL